MEPDSTPKNELKKVEEALLGVLLIAPEVLPDVTGWLTPEMFSQRKNGFIYQAILQQYNQGKAPDFATTELQMSELDEPYNREIGGLTSLQEAVRNIRHAGNAVNYARKVKHYYVIRLIQGYCREALSKSQLQPVDTSELIRNLTDQLLAAEETAQETPVLQQLGQAHAQMVEMHYRNMEEEVNEHCIITGLQSMDMLLGGLHRGELYVLGGRPGDGKTAVSLEIAMRAARQQKGVCFFSMEMINTQHEHRLTAGYSSIRASQLRYSTFSERDMKAMEELSREWLDLPFYIDYTPGNTVQNIRSQVLLYKKRHPCHLVVIDYLHLLRSEVQRGETPDQIVGRNITALKRLALEAECAVVVLSQMNHQSENRPEKGFRPNLSDLRVSGMIEQAADVVFFVYRPARHGITFDTETNERLENVCDLIVRKNRNGLTGTARLKHNTTFTRFEDFYQGDTQKDLF